MKGNREQLIKTAVEYYRYLNTALEDAEQNLTVEYIHTRALEFQAFLHNDLQNGLWTTWVYDDDAQRFTHLRVYKDRYDYLDQEEPEQTIEL